MKSLDIFENDWSELRVRRSSWWQPGQWMAGEGGWVPKWELIGPNLGLLQGQVGFRWWLWWEKNLLAIKKTWVQFLGREDSLEEGMATHYSVLAWRTPWTEEPGRLQSTGLQRFGHDWSNLAHTHRERWVEEGKSCTEILRPEMGLMAALQTKAESTGKEIFRSKMTWPYWTRAVKRHRGHALWQEGDTNIRI